jgi:hypothetical protein
VRRNALPRLAVIGLFCLAGAAGWALPELPRLPENLLFKWDPRLWGLDLALGWKGWDLFPGVDTVLWASTGGGWQSNLLFDDPDDSTAPARAQLDTIDYSYLSLDWRLGVAQGLVFDPAQDRNLVELLLLYRGKYQHYLYDHGVLDGLPERDGLLQHSLVVGLLFDNTFRDKISLNRRGYYGALSAELVPRWLGNDVLGLSDYWRLSLVLIGYQPVLASPGLSIYLAERFLLDRIFGEAAAVPATALGAIGALTKVPIGYNPLRALGGALRGVYNNRYDGLAKLVGNFDLRLHFPSLTAFKLATPMAVAYFDAGVYDRMTGVLQFDQVYCATGLGVGLYALGFDFILYGTYFLNEGDLYYGLGLGVHF